MLFVIDSSQMFGWCFLLDVIVCGLSILTLVIFTEATSTDQSDDIEESITIDSIFCRSKNTKFNAHAVLRGLGNFNLLQRCVEF